jgi:hypothetical protein
MVMLTAQSGAPSHHVAWERAAEPRRANIDDLIAYDV